MPFAFRLDLFGPAEVTQLIERIKATPRRPGIDEICIPSERAFRSRERALREGLEIDRVVFDALVALRARGKDSAGGGVSSEPFG